MVQGPPYDGTGQANRDIAERLVNAFNSVAGHISTSNHVHAHRHLDELYFAGPEGAQSDGGVATQDYIIQNPSGSGKTVEIINFKVTASVGYEESWYYNATYPSGGTAITPWGTGDHSTTATFNAKYGSDIVDETTADRRLPNGIVGGTKQNPTTSETIGSDILVSEGETVHFRVVLNATNERFGYFALVAEYDTGRDAEDPTV